MNISRHASCSACRFKYGLLLRDFERDMQRRLIHTSPQLGRNRKPNVKKGQFNSRFQNLGAESPPHVSIKSSTSRHRGPPSKPCDRKDDDKKTTHRHHKLAEIRPPGPAKSSDNQSFNTSHDTGFLLPFPSPALFADFERAIKFIFRSVVTELKTNVDAVAKQMQIPPEEIPHQIAEFRNLVMSDLYRAMSSGQHVSSSSARLCHLWSTFHQYGSRLCASKAKYLFYDWLITRSFSAADRARLQKVADCRYPSEWYPATRSMHRKIILHVGPTNSGKTYHALQRLEQASTGIFAGPLRLLAHEVYTRMNAKGKLCSLITGEEQRIPQGLTKTMSSCTVEMMPLNTVVDVAVIDEIQMIGDEHRGWAWTQALLGVMAKEVHLCGEPRTVSLIQAICASIGDELEIREYDRLGPLMVEHKSLGGDISKLVKGDALVAFSRKHIHTLKRLIEMKHPEKRCAVVYGSLPPEVRAQQAELFNNPDNNVDFLCASDAIGMGLNLSVRRVVFEAITKFDGANLVLLNSPHVKQIAGRAGRYRSAHQAMTVSAPQETGEPVVKQAASPAIGYVTTLQKTDLSFIEKTMKKPLEPLQRAWAFPPTDALVKFARFFPPTTPFSYIIIKFDEMTQWGSRFQHAKYNDHILIADAIQQCNLTIEERVIFCAAPVKTDLSAMEVVQAFATCVANKTGGALVDIPEIRLEYLEASPQSKTYLRDLEALHFDLVTYLWLSYRFPSVFVSRELARHVSLTVGKRIEGCLEHSRGDEELIYNRLREKSTMELKPKGVQGSPQPVEDDLAHLLQGLRAAEPEVVTC